MYCKKKGRKVQKHNSNINKHQMTSSSLKSYCSLLCVPSFSPKSLKGFGKILQT